MMFVPSVSQIVVIETAMIAMVGSMSHASSRKIALRCRDGVAVEPA